jgi:glucans biosynthesis protein
MADMYDLSRRALLVSIVAASGARLTAPAAAQQTDAPPPAAPAPTPFGYQDVVKRARDLAAAPFDSAIAALPDGLATLDFDGWRDIRFKSDKLCSAWTGPVSG